MKHEFITFNLRVSDNKVWYWNVFHLPHIKTHTSAGKLIMIFGIWKDHILFISYLRMKQSIVTTTLITEAKNEVKRHAKLSEGVILLQDTAWLDMVTRIILSLSSRSWFWAAGSCTYHTVLTCFKWFSSFWLTERGTARKPFCSDEEVIEALQNWLYTRPESFFQEWRDQALAKRWTKCIWMFRGDYVEN